MSHGFHVDKVLKKNEHIWCEFCAISELGFSSDNQKDYEELICANSDHVSCQDLSLNDSDLGNFAYWIKIWSILKFLPLINCTIINKPIFS